MLQHWVRSKQFSYTVFVKSPHSTNHCVPRYSDILSGKGEGVNYVNYGMFSITWRISHTDCLKENEDLEEKASAY